MERFMSEGFFRSDDVESHESLSGCALLSILCHLSRRSQRFASLFKHREDNSFSIFALRKKIVTSIDPNDFTNVGDWTGQDLRMLRHAIAPVLCVLDWEFAETQTEQKRSSKLLRRFYEYGFDRRGRLTEEQKAPT
jgi:hypothetical protein